MGDALRCDFPSDPEQLRLLVLVEPREVYEGPRRRAPAGHTEMAVGETLTKGGENRWE